VEVILMTAASGMWWQHIVEGINDAAWNEVAPY